jgi:hypothetical protein
MYRINLDIIYKIICIEISGSITIDEINTYIKEIGELVNIFRPNQYSMLLSVRRLDPFPQDSLPIVQKAFELSLNWAKKIAIVNGNRIITKIQLERIVSTSRENIKSDIQILQFHTIREAMNYLNKI